MATGVRRRGVFIRVRPTSSGPRSRAALASGRPDRDSGADGKRADADARTLGHQLTSTGRAASGGGRHVRADRRTNVRWVPILALIAIGTAINYLDRTVLSIAAPHLSKDLSLTPTQMGLVFSAFSWSYAALQIPGGIFLDRFGTRLTYFIAIAFWSLFTGLMGVVSSFAGLIFTRLGVGVFEAPCFPANSRILATWFPQHERARANSVYSVGMNFGLGFLSVPLFWITQQFGWRGLFLIVGAVGIAFSFVWWALYRNPSEQQDRQPRRARLHRGRRRRRIQGTAARLQVALHRAAAAAPAGDRRVDRPVRRQFDAGVLPDVVSDLPRHRARDDVHQGGLHDRRAVHRRGGRRGAGRLRLGRDPETHRLGQHGAEASDRLGHAAGVDDHPRQLRARGEERAWSSRSCRSPSSARA